MKPGDYEISTGGNHDESDVETLEDVRRALAEARSLAPEAISNEDIIDAYRQGGFSDWPAERARRVVRALSEAAGIQHV